MLGVPLIEDLDFVLVVGQVDRGVLAQVVIRIIPIHESGDGRSTRDCSRTGLEDVLALLPRSGAWRIGDLLDEVRAFCFATRVLVGVLDFDFDFRLFYHQEIRHKWNHIPVLATSPSVQSGDNLRKARVREPSNTDASINLSSSTSDICATDDNRTDGKVACRARLGGLFNFYYRDAV